MNFVTFFISCMKINEYFSSYNTYDVRSMTFDLNILGEEGKVKFISAAVVSQQHTYKKKMWEGDIDFDVVLCRQR